MRRVSTQPDLRLAPEGLVTPVSERVEVLVERARAGDVDAWARLYQDFFDRVFRHLCYLTGDATEAEDLVQETFARALIALSDFRGTSSFSTWLMGVGLNVARHQWRRRRNTRKALGVLRNTLDFTASEHGDPMTAHQHRRKAEALYAVLAEIPEPMREAFILLDLEQLRPAEAGELLGTSAGNASVRAHRARLRVRSELDRLGWLEGGAR